MSRDKKVKVTGTTRNPKASKVPAPGKPSAQLYRGKLGERLNVEWAEFNLSDPNMKVMCGAYNCLHDPLLKSFFKQPERKKQLLKQDLITDDEKVLCSLKEFNQYTEYIKKVQLSWNKLFIQEQKQLMQDFMLQKMEGGVPETIDPTHTRDRLISRGRSTFRNMSKKLMKPGDNLHAALLALEAIQRLHLEEFEKELIRELRLKRRLPQVPGESRKSGAATSAPPNTPASSDKGLASPNKADQISSEKAEGAGGVVMKVEDLQNSENKSSLVAEEQNKPVPAGLGFVVQPSPLDLDGLTESGLDKSDSSEILVSLQRKLSKQELPKSSDAQMVSADSEVIMGLVSGNLRKIQDSPSTDSSLSRTSSMDTFIEMLGMLEIPSSSVALRSSPASLASQPMSLSSSSSSLNLDSDGQMVSPDLEDATDLVSGLLGKIQDLLRTYSNLSLPGVSSDDSSELQSFPAMGCMLESPNPSVAFSDGRRSSFASSESSDITLMDLEMSFHSHRESSSSSPVSSHSDGLIVSPDSELAMDLVSGILKRIEDSPSLETSFNSQLTSPTSSPMSPDSDAQMVSPDSEPAWELVSGVLRKIQDSPSSEGSLTGTSSIEMLGMLESLSSSADLRSSPASFKSSEITLIDLETSFDSQPMSLSSSSLNLDSEGQMVSPDSEVTMDLVSGILRRIENSPSLETSFNTHPASPTSSNLSSDSDAQMISRDSEASRDLVSDILRRTEDSLCLGLSPLDPSILVETPSIPSSHNLEYLEVTDAAADIIGLVLQNLETEIGQSDGLDAGGGSLVTPTTRNNPTGTKHLRIRKRVHNFFSRSWESVRQIFTFARRSNKIHPA